VTGGAGRGRESGGPGGAGEPFDSIGYAEALNELETILAELEHEAVDVDHLVERVQRAAALIRLCRGRIASARIEIETVVADLERAATDESGGAPEAPS
jgi:exodeoxyribonuclease VII small subunit